jgi:glycosyltransferase involved in cell wall biosynthesis
VKDSIRSETAAALKEVGSVDIFIGIPSYNCEKTIEFVISAVAIGLERFYPDKKAIIFISDGGSTDDTRECALNTKTGSLPKLVAIYRGVSGKGSAFLQIFEASSLLNAKATAIFESDLKSISPEWIKNILDPVLEHNYDLVTPAYKRFKFDATITTTIAYNLTRAIYGADIWQPIGGDWALSTTFVRFLLTQEIWNNDIAKYGVDIWMTTRALVYNFKIAQAKLGVKVRRDKDPNDLSAMFYQVVGTIFKMTETDFPVWSNIKGVREVPVFGDYVGVEPQSFLVDKLALLEYYKGGFANFSAVWRELLGDEIFGVLETLNANATGENFYLPIESWVKIVYIYAGAYRRLERQRGKLLSTLIPIYNARVASIIDALSDEQVSAHEYFEKQAKAFEAAKPMLIEMYR